MPDEFFNRTPPGSLAPRKPAGVGRLVVGIAALSFLLGGGLVGYLAYNGQLRMEREVATTAPAPTPAMSGTRPAASPSPASSSTALPIAPAAPVATAGLATSVLPLDEIGSSIQRRVASTHLLATR